MAIELRYLNYRKTTMVLHDYQKGNYGVETHPEERVFTKLQYRNVYDTAEEDWTEWIDVPTEVEPSGES